MLNPSPRNSDLTVSLGGVPGISILDKTSCIILKFSWGKNFVLALKSYYTTFLPKW